MFSYIYSADDIIQCTAIFFILHMTNLVAQIRVVRNLNANKLFLNMKNSVVRYLDLRPSNIYEHCLQN